MSFKIENLPEAVRKAKRKLRALNPNYATTFKEVEEEMKRQVAEIVKERASGTEVIPVVQYAEIASGNVPEALKNKIKQRGACVIREVFSPEKLTQWDNDLAKYVEVNGLDAKLANAAEDKYFSALAASKPQIYGIYWSKPQVLARQSESLTNTRVFLNNLWKSESEGRRHFDPNQTPVYADRIRRRPPGATSLGLSPHVDGGSVERWLEENFQQVYRHAFSGDWRKYDPWDAAHRVEVQEVDSPAACSMFRTFQGWTALTRQGKGDGTLQLIPIANSLMYVMLRALQDDTADDDLCGAKPGRVLSVTPEWHAPLIDAVTSIPLMEPGDTVFWHSDCVHAVENEHTGKGWSNVMYIGSTVGCDKNWAYVEQQKPKFLEGRTPPNFAPDDFEVDFVGRATVDDLSALGKSQLGLLPH
jgi:hypothetical protein